MGIEAAVRQTGLLHDVGDAGAVVAAAPDGARGGLDTMRSCVASLAAALAFILAFRMTYIIRYFPAACAPDFGGGRIAGNPSRRAYDVKAFVRRWRNEMTGDLLELRLRRFKGVFSRGVASTQAGLADFVGDVR